MPDDQPVTIDDLSATMRRNLLSLLESYPTPRSDLPQGQAQALEVRGLVTSEGDVVRLTDGGRRMAGALKVAPLSASEIRRRPLT